MKKASKPTSKRPVATKLAVKKPGAKKPVAKKSPAKPTRLRVVQADLLQAELVQIGERLDAIMGRLNEVERVHQLSTQPANPTVQPMHQPADKHGDDVEVDLTPIGEGEE